MSFSEEGEAMACEVLEKGRLYRTAGLDTKHHAVLPSTRQDSTQG